LAFIASCPADTKSSSLPSAVIAIFSSSCGISSLVLSVDECFAPSTVSLLSANKPTISFSKIFISTSFRAPISKKDL
jgi:hypothetical protein